MDRGAWWATVQRVAESDMTEVTEHAHIHTLPINNVVAVSGGQQRNSAGHISTCIHSPPNSPPTQAAVQC